MSQREQVTVHTVPADTRTGVRVVWWSVVLFIALLLLLFVFERSTRGRRTDSLPVPITCTHGVP